MVEGPGCTRNGTKVQAAVGKKATSDVAPASPALPPQLAGSLAGLTLAEAFTVGKELFLIFTAFEDAPTHPHSETAADVGVRLHFGMNGSMRVRKAKAGDTQNKSSGWRQKSDPTLRLYFVTDGDASNYTVLEAWETTVSPVSARNARIKLTNLRSRDVCSTSFNAQDVFTAIRQSGNNLIIADALLNQNLMPGAGNIIKIESLHRSRVDPRRVVSSLTDGELRRVIRHTRKYSMDWLKTGRAGTKLVYNQTTCGTCNGVSVKMQKMGGSEANGSGQGHAFMSRVTFWCTVCQPLQVASGENRAQASAPGSANRTTTESNGQQAHCPQHGHTSLKLRRARNGNNGLRIFFTCTRKDCQYFLWADSTFSQCRCGKKTVLRVSKTERSGGRWFLCCASGDKSKGGSSSNGCGHFEWASDKQLGPLRCLLTPLL
ncbi:hypothetical protein ACHAXT_004409 [Thalassiosira profunda]